MIIGIIVAMESELKMLLPLIENISSTQVDGFTIHCGRIGNNAVAVMQTGIGKVNAAVGAIDLIDNFKPDLVINTGIAGGTGRGAGIFDVVIATEIGYHDVYCGPGNERGQVQGQPTAYACATDSLPAVNELRSRPDVKFGQIASGDLFVSTPEELRSVLEVRPDAMAVDMESGAIAQVCWMRKVPFLALRVVSDTPGVENHHDQYSNFFTIAPATTFSILKALLS